MMTDVLTGDEQSDPKPVSGVWVATGILGLGLLFTAGLWWYTDLHVSPFRDLRDAIQSELPGSVPQVEGGQRKIHRETPKILRITLRVHEDPRGNDHHVAEVMDRLVSLADKHHGLAGYDLLDVYLVWFRPEQKAVSRHEQREVRRLLETGLVQPEAD